MNSARGTDIFAHAPHAMSPELRAPHQVALKLSEASEHGEPHTAHGGPGVQRHAAHVEQVHGESLLVP